MKRWIALLLVAALGATLFGAVHAENATAFGDGLHVYIGQGDTLHETGVEQPLGEDVISAIYAADSLYVIYATSVELVEDLDREEALYMMSLAGEEPAVEEIDGDTVASVWSKADGVLYYVCYGEPNVLKSYDPALQTAKSLTEAPGAITALRVSVDGLLATVDGQEMLYIPVVKMLTAPAFSHEGYTIRTGDNFETLLDAEGKLSLRRVGSESAFQLDVGVTAAEISGEQVYYLTATEKGMALMAYNAELASFAQLCALEQKMLPQIAMGESVLFLMDEAENVYAYPLVSGELTKITTAPTGAIAPTLRAVANIALLYDEGAEPADRFIEAVPFSVEPEPQPEPEPEPEPEPDPDPDPDPDPTPAPRPEPKPAPTDEPEARTLSKGMRGDDVQEMQQALKDHGYLSGAADGIFGGATQSALMYLQSDMGLAESGTADLSLQNKIKSGSIPDFTKYVALSKGDEGIRVRELQTRLRTLYYMTVNAGGHYKDATVAAVKRFQKQMGYKQTGKMTAKEMKALFGKDCPNCTNYYELSKGDSSPAVKRLNNRLKKLGYFSGSAGESFGKATLSAIKKFQSYNGLQSTGKCDANLQYMIYDKNAKHYKPDPDPDPDPDPTRKPSWNKPNAKQLKAMRSWMSKFYGGKWNDKQVANAIQGQLSNLGYLEWGYQSGKYDKATWSAVRDFQSAVIYGHKATGIADKTTLGSLFG